MARHLRTPLLWLSLLGAAASVHAQDAAAVLARLGHAQFETLRGAIRLEQSPAPSMGAPTTPEASTVTLIRLVLAPPDRFAIVMTAPTSQGDGLCQSDGTQAMYISSMLGQVSVTTPPATLDGIGERRLALTGAGGSILVPSLIGLSHPLVAALDTGSAWLASPEEIAGAPCDVVALRNISGGASSEIRLAVDAHGILRSADILMSGPRAVHLRERFTVLELDAPLRETDFTTPLPANLLQVPDFDPTLVATASPEA